MGIFDMFSGRKARLALIEAERQQAIMQAQLMQKEAANEAEARARFAQEQAQMERQLQETRKANKKRQLEQSVAQLGGMVGFRSLLSGRKGGGGFGPRSMLDAA
jgi:hypothetical protein